MDNMSNEKNEVLRRFGERLMLARRSKGMTQEELSYESGCNQYMICMYECGKRDPKLTTVLKLASALDISAGMLMEDIDLYAEDL